MRKEYDLSNGERGKLFGKVDTSKVTIDDDDTNIDEAVKGELYALEANLDRIQHLKPRLPELDPKSRRLLAKRLADAKAKLDEMAIPE